MADLIRDGVRTISLTRGLFALVDELDYDWLVGLGSWYYVPRTDGRTGYAVRQTYVDRRKRTVFMHRLLCPSSAEVDHINQNKLDNRRTNLRSATRTQNMRNRPSFSGSSSGYKGVYWHKGRQVWVASIQIDGRLQHLGRFADEDAAARAYDRAAADLFGEFACLNFPLTAGGDRS